MKRSPQFSFTVPLEHDGDRLDAALCFAFPEIGVRARRRLWDHNKVTVNGHNRPAGFRVRNGDEVRLTPLQQEEASSELTGALALQTEVSILCLEKNYAAVFKPSGLHSAAIASSPSPCVEDMLPKLFSNRQNSAPKPEEARPALLVNRLDKATSGMLIVAFGEQAAEVFRHNERTGKTEKLYLAVVQGELTTPLLCPWELNTDNRTITTALPREEQDQLRHTSVLPLGPVEFTDTPQANPKTTLVLASIHRGARHQIRAHLAHAGYPIVGDKVYGNSAAAQNDPHLMYLHHFKFEMKGISCICPPRWPLWDQWAAALKSLCPS
ncbi:pseudouridine synthase [Oleidesulfovibrio sp.]|uniref:pseudouridine synthase n=1 Tax=Oleidesulfovibrio sp. TaxID=2909707 RepID=UPI003A8A5C51